jgi:hypothetical protein
MLTAFYQSPRHHIMRSGLALNQLPQQLPQGSMIHFTSTAGHPGH